MGVPVFDLTKIRQLEATGFNLGNWDTVVFQCTSIASVFFLQENNQSVFSLSGPLRNLKLLIELILNYVYAEVAYSFSKHLLQDLCL